LGLPFENFSIHKNDPKIIKYSSALLLPINIIYLLDEFGITHSSVTFVKTISKCIDNEP
jgi:hypothetical protein